MTPDSIHKLLARYENGDRLTRDEKERIYQHANEPEFRNRLVDRLAVADLLSFEETSKDASSFVAATAQRFSQEFPRNELPIVISEPSSRSSVETRVWTLPQKLMFTIAVLFSGFLLGAWAWSTWLPSPAHHATVAPLSTDSVEDSNSNPELVEPILSDSVVDDSVLETVEPQTAESSLAGVSEFETEDLEQNPDSSMNVAQADLPEVQFPSESKGEMERPVEPSPVPMVETQAAPVFLATIRDSEKAKWTGTRESESQLTAGMYELLDGKTHVELNNGVEVAILAPSKFEILAENRIKFESGIYAIEMPRKQVDLAIETPQAKLYDGNYARVQLIVGDQKSETLLTRGSINLLPQKDLPGDELKLQKNNLVQTVIQQNGAMPRMLAATGPRKFEARLGEGAKQAKFSSPIVFGNVLQNMESFDQKNPKLARQPQSWQTLVDRIQTMPSNPTKEQIEEQFKKLFGGNQQIPQKNRDENSNRSSSFQGSFSTNGVTREFNSLEDFEKFHREWMNPRANRARQNHRSTPRQIPLQFSSPEIFRQLRKQMR